MARKVLDPVVVLAGNVAQESSGDGIGITIGAEEANHAFWLLKGLDKSVEQDAVKATVVEKDVILMMLVKGVHGYASLCAAWNHTPRAPFTSAGSWFVYDSTAIRRKDIPGSGGLAKGS